MVLARPHLVLSASLGAQVSCSGEVAVAI